MLRVDQVTFVYGARTERPTVALTDLSLSVHEGEFLAVVGHNGSGKSTLARLLNGLLLPTKGNVLVGELSTRNPNQIWQVRQQVGMVFQNPDNQLVATTVEDDIAFGPENLGLPPAVTRARVEEALHLLDIAEIRREPPHLLSGGQKQRVAIAGALAMRPRFLVLDEPTALLDPAGRREVLGCVLDVCRREGIGVVLITHFMAEAVPADRVLVLEAGRMVLEGTPRAVFARADELRALALEVPLVTRVAQGLRQRGLPLPPDLLTAEELVRHLCPLK